MEGTLALRGQIDLDPAREVELLTSFADVGIDFRGRAVSPDRGEATVLALAGWTAQGRSWLQAIRAATRARIVVLLLGDGLRPAAAAWEMLAAGADDVVEAADPRRAGAILRAKLARWRELDAVVASPLVRGTLVGRSPAVRRLACEVVEAARYSKASVLVEGESGTGKELVAGLLHRCSPGAADGRAVLVDCSTLHTELALSELFGHEAGAFTGAAQARAGAIADADGGTLLLDEVGELPLPVQAHLLRFLQEGQIRRVGSNRYTRVQTRIVAATNRSLRDEVQRGRFREDLYHRLASIHIRIPPLRDRIEDIPDLVEHFLAEEFGDGDRPVLPRALLDHLQTRSYPGNVRELRQLVRSILVRHARGSGVITAGELPPRDRPGGETPCCCELFERAIVALLATGHTLKDIERRAKEVAIRLAIARHDGDRGRAARSLDVTPRTLSNHQGVEPA